MQGFIQAVSKFQIQLNRRKNKILATHPTFNNYSDGEKCKGLFKPRDWMGIRKQEFIAKKTKPSNFCFLTEFAEVTIFVLHVVYRANSEEMKSMLVEGFSMKIPLELVWCNN